MKWSPGGRSPDLEDRRGARLSGGGFGVRRGLPLGLGGLAVLFVISLLTGQDFLSLLSTDGGAGTGGPLTESAPPATSPEEEQQVQFVSFVLDDAQATWERLLPRYERAKLVLFREAVESACGVGESATGPFYCPGDRKVYIDLGFFADLRRRFGAPGEFAQAYVLAHEIGHHVQTLLGTEAQMRRLQRASPGDANALSVRLELQADCYAGVWGHSTAQRQILEAGDVENGLNAAAAIGDDRLQRMSSGRVMPERFTHGSSAQRVEWFRRGLETGRVEACDTFSGGR
jgi:predicted metalloprotease